MVQHNAAKFVTNRYPKKGHYSDFSISEIINELGWDSDMSTADLLPLQTQQEQHAPQNK